jgi:hypothetical protein
MEQDFGIAFVAFMKAAQQRVADDYAAWTKQAKISMGAGPTLEPMGGPRYIRIVSVDGTTRSAFGFVDKTNGNVLKAASWKAPAKNFSRGNIFDEQHGCGRIRWTGVN